MRIAERVVIGELGGFRISAGKEVVHEDLVPRLGSGLVVPCAVHCVPLAVKLYGVPCVGFGLSDSGNTQTRNERAGDTVLLGEYLEALGVACAYGGNAGVAVALRKGAVRGLVSVHLRVVIFSL